MSSIATAWAWATETKQNEKLVLLYLAENADLWGSGTKLGSLLEQLPAICDADSQTIRKHRHRLESKGLLETDGDDFRLPLPKPDLPTKGFYFES